MPCARCRLRSPPFRSARAELVYRDGSEVARAVQRWKYDCDEVVVAALATVFRERFGSDLGRYDRIVPVPAHPRRLRRRGFNPALTLARAIAPRRALVAPALLRRHGPESQVGRGFQARAANVPGRSEYLNMKADS